MGKNRQTQPASALGRREMLRWMWRQLTSMRTALTLLLLLAIVAIPGSLYPQRSINPRSVAQYISDNPKVGPIMDKLGLFEVYTSPWFSGVYLLLMISLIGCIVPRTKVYYRALRARPPRAPRNLLRFGASLELETSSSPEEVMAATKRALGRARVDVVENGDAVELSAEKGYLREAGNLLFHISVVVVLVGVAMTALLGYRGAAIVTEGDRFSNVLTQYDEFGSGALFDRDDLPEFTFTMKSFSATYQVEGEQRGAPLSFNARGTYTEGKSDKEQPFDIRVNYPLKLAGSSVYLVGQGYSPVIRVKNPDGQVVFDEPVPFLPTDSSYTSNGVVKVAEAEPEQLGFQGFFLPTYTTGADGATRSSFPAPYAPIIGLFVWRGDLGIDDGQPQSVFVLDKRNMKQYMSKEDPKKGYRVSLQPGQTQKLPGGHEISFVGLKQFARFQIASTPGVQIPLIGTILGLIGLVGSLSVRPRRTWVRARRSGSRTVVQVAVLDRVPRVDLPADFDRFAQRLRDQLAPPVGEGDKSE